MNKKTGKIVETGTMSFLVGAMGRYHSLAELNEEWEDMPEEEWRDILGFEGLYQVSSYGNVKTIKKDGVEMSQQENRNGYMTVHLRDKGVERRAMVHRLVAEAFIPNPNELRDVNHKNGDKSDNRLENLEWASHSDNMTHSFRELGKNVRHIVQLDLDNNFIERWNSIAEASEATGICRTNIGECCRGNRKHAKGYKWKYEEDYEGPKGVKSIYSTGATVYIEMSNQKEAIEVEEKLKAWKRLKDKGFRFEGIKEDYTRVLQQKPFRNGKRYLQFNKSEDEDWLKENWEDLDSLFSQGDD